MDRSDGGPIAGEQLPHYRTQIHKSYSTNSRTTRSLVLLRVRGQKPDFLASRSIGKWTISQLSVVWLCRLSYVPDSSHQYYCRTTELRWKAGPSQPRFGSTFYPSSGPSSVHSPQGSERSAAVLRAVQVNCESIALSSSHAHELPNLFSSHISPIGMCLTSKLCHRGIDVHSKVAYRIY